MRIQTGYFPLAGGWNLESPPLATSPGELIDVANYECLVGGGYRRIFGYELYDGQASSPQAVPGSGPVLGVHIYKDDVYAIREDGVNGRLYKATVSGWTEVNPAFTWSLGGTYRFENYNFFGQDDQEEMFIVNGVDKCVKFDGTTLVEITTGLVTDAPKLVVGYKTFLFLAIESSLIYSGAGDPTAWDPVNDFAGEIAAGDTITDLIAGPSSLIVGCQDSTKVLYGSTSPTASLPDPFQFDELNKIGPYPNTLQQIGGQIYGLDRQGVMSLQAAQQYGNFSYLSITRKIQGFMSNFGTTSVASINRNSSQYRLFNGNLGIYITFVGSELVGITRVSYEDPVRCITSGFDAAKKEISFFGSDDGKVMKMDTGFSFAGQPINSYLVTSFHHFQTPTLNKRFRMIQPDVRVSGDDVTLAVSATSDYSNGLISRGSSNSLVQTGGALYDYSLWDQFKWDSVYHHDAPIRVSLTGTNMAVLVSSLTLLNTTHSIYGMALHYSPRRLKR